LNRIEKLAAQNLWAESGQIVVASILHHDAWHKAQGELYSCAQKMPFL
jgi:hypothetical protein